MRLAFVFWGHLLLIAPGKPPVIRAQTLRSMPARSQLSNLPRTWVQWFLQIPRNGLEFASHHSSPCQDVWRHECFRLLHAWILGSQTWHRVEMLDIRNWDDWWAPHTVSSVPSLPCLGGHSHPECLSPAPSSKWFLEISQVPSNLGTSHLKCAQISNLSIIWSWLDMWNLSSHPRTFGFRVHIWSISLSKM